MRTNSIWKNREYLKFFASYTVGNIGDWFDIFALQIIFAHQLKASPIMLSFLLILYLAPMAFFGSFAGIITDKLQKKNILLITDILSGVVTLLLIISHSVLLSLLIVFIRSSFASLNAPAQQSALKYIVDETQLLKASSYNQTIFQLCQVIGPLLGAGIITISSPYWCLGINAISFFVSALFLLMLKPIQETGGEIIKTNFVANLKDTWNIIKSNKILLNIFILAILMAIPTMMSYSQLVVLLNTIYPDNQTILGVVSGISGIGTIVSAVYLSRKTSFVHYINYLVLGTILMGISSVVLALYPQHFYYFPLYLTSFIGGIGFGIGVIVYSYLQKKETPHQYMGRVSGTMSMIMAISYIIGALLGGIITSIAGIRLTFLLMGIIYFILTCYSTVWKKSHR